MAEERDSLLVTPKIFADLPLEAKDEARFQFDAYANTFARIIADPSTQTPLTICISGEWGTGKTTLMKAIQSRLDQTGETEKQVPCFVNSQEEAKGLRVCKTVWFNAWKYAGQQEAMFVALIEEILRKMRQDDRLITRVRAFLKDPKEPEVHFSEAVLNALGQIFTAGQIDFDLTAFYKESRFKQNLAFQDEFQVVFDRLLNWWVGRREDKKGVLAIFIDDLDRCLPDKTVQVLETIKLFLDKPACVFVLGADTTVIQSAIEAHYETEKIKGVTAKDYLDKIIQLRFELPHIREADMAVFVQGLKLSDEALLSNLDTITSGVRTNPRRVKTFINYLELQWAMLKNSGQAESIRRQDFTQWLVLTEAGPEFCDHIRNLPLAERVEFILGAAALARGEEDEVLRGSYGRWLDPHPRLRRVLAQEGFVFEVDPDTLDRFIFLSAPPVEVVEKEAHREGAAIKVAEVPETVLVPAGPFLMGSTEDNRLASADERPQHQVELDAFRIGRYLVTNAQYARFIEDGGYENPDYWIEAGWAWREAEAITRPRFWEDPRWNQPNHPVVGVSWYEALAYCRWLNEVTGEKFHLPSEAEWEKAARGEHGREWPWGNEFDQRKCNTLEGGPAKTTPVGQYSPAGDSPYGAADMAGNVWEWCSTLFRDYPYRPDDGREDLETEGSRVLRGGSWPSDQYLARCAARFGYFPGSRDDYLGFRVAASPSSP
jgi:formylglycine-generating enzyme required for sulfatase activity